MTTLERIESRAEEIEGGEEGSLVDAEEVKVKEEKEKKRRKVEE